MHTLKTAILMALTTTQVQSIHCGQTAPGEAGTSTSASYSSSYANAATPTACPGSETYCWSATFDDGSGGETTWTGGCATADNCGSGLADHIQTQTVAITDTWSSAALVTDSFICKAPVMCATATTAARGASTSTAVGSDAWCELSFDYCWSAEHGEGDETAVAWTGGCTTAATCASSNASTHQTALVTDLNAAGMTDATLVSGSYHCTKAVSCPTATTTDRGAVPSTAVGASVWCPAGKDYCHSAEHGEGNQTAVAWTGECATMATCASSNAATHKAALVTELNAGAGMTAATLVTDSYTCQPGWPDAVKCAIATTAARGDTPATAVGGYEWCPADKNHCWSAVHGDGNQTPATWTGGCTTAAVCSDPTAHLATLVNGLNAEAGVSAAQLVTDTFLCTKALECPTTTAATAGGTLSTTPGSMEWCQAGQNLCYAGVYGTDATTPLTWVGGCATTTNCSDGLGTFGPAIVTALNGASGFPSNNATLNTDTWQCPGAPVQCETAAAATVGNTLTRGAEAWCGEKGETHCWEGTYGAGSDAATVWIGGCATAEDCTASSSAETALKLAQTTALNGGSSALNGNTPTLTTGSWLCKEPLSCPTTAAATAKDNAALTAGAKQRCDLDDTVCYGALYGDAAGTGLTWVGGCAKASDCAADLSTFQAGVITALTDGAVFTQTPVMTTGTWSCNECDLLPPATHLTSCRGCPSMTSCTCATNYTLETNSDGNLACTPASCVTKDLSEVTGDLVADDCTYTCVDNATSTDAVCACDSGFSANEAMTACTADSDDTSNDTSTTSPAAGLAAGLATSLAAVVLL